MPDVDVGALAVGVRGGDRRSLARAITLVESQRPEQRAEAITLLDALQPTTGGAARVAISGPPGVGKSTLIEGLGVHVVRDGHKVAVLAIDPSSARSGGSILGDKTRMEVLAREPDAFIRPSPSSGALGGVARRTREAMLVCEAAGFDVVLIETVGVGQSEIEVDAMVDTFVLLAAPGAGDELQGIKRGVMEMADVVVVTKADGDLLGLARQAASDHQRALHLLRPKHAGWTAEVVLGSARMGEGIAEIWAAVQRHRSTLESTGVLAARRAEQAKTWLWSEVREQALERVYADPARRDLVPVIEADVAAGVLSPEAGARRLLSSS
ncbi:MAG: methylmalonyl Co-A mutase-associated GTPase MeaB [Acidimicrobiales bacterium]